MTTKITIESLAAWISDIIEAAKDDTSFSIAWFPGTQDKPFSIIAGWQKLPNMPEVFCTSKSQPEYVMSIKVVENDNQVCPDFDSLLMPTDTHGEVDDTCMPLEWTDPPEVAAQFFLMEWERIMKEHKEEV